MDSKYNPRNPAVKRIMQEMKEMREHKSTEFIAEALESDIFEWHFVIKGPADTEFQGGIYHGRVLLPPEYPFKPPAFMMLSPSGRFETGVKICLSISSHHPEHWQPSWSIRTALTALIAFMPSPGQGALGSLDFPKEERRVMATRSRTDIPRFGSADRQRVIDDMHSRMLALQAEAPAQAGEVDAASARRSSEVAATPSPQTTSAPAPTTPAPAPEQLSSPSITSHAAKLAPQQAPAVVTAQAAPASLAASAAQQQPHTAQSQAGRRAAVTAHGAAASAHATATDHMLTAMMWALYVGIGAILLRKAMAAFGLDLPDGPAFNM